MYVIRYTFPDVFCLTRDITSPQACMLHCLTTVPAEAVLVSYNPGLGLLGLGDQFNCLCGLSGWAGAGAGRVPGQQCHQPCPAGGLVCGQPERDLLSVYCLTRDCPAPGPALCTGQEGGVAGCALSRSLDWGEAVAVGGWRGDNRAQCVEVCGELQGAGQGTGQMALTRQTDLGLTCTCASPAAVPPQEVLATPVCALLASLPTYSITCGAGPLEPVSPAPRPAGPAFLGCLQTELFLASEVITVRGEGAEQGEPALCQLLCLPLHSLATVGVHWDGNALSCHCSVETAPRPALLGPAAGCHTSCPAHNTSCGGPGMLSVYRAGLPGRGVGAGQDAESKLVEAIRWDITWH